MKQTAPSHSQIVIDKDNAESADPSQQKAWDTIAAALKHGRMKERERCALIAESFEDAEHDRLSAKTRHLTARAIAAAIRNTQATKSSGASHNPELSQGSPASEPKSNFSRVSPATSDYKVLIALTVRAKQDEKDRIKNLLGQLPENSNVAECVAAIDGDESLIDDQNSGNEEKSV